MNSRQIIQHYGEETVEVLIRINDALLKWHSVRDLPSFGMITEELQTELAEIIWQALHSKPPCARETPHPRACGCHAEAPERTGACLTAAPVNAGAVSGTEIPPERSGAILAPTGVDAQNGAQNAGTDNGTVT